MFCPKCGDEFVKGQTVCPDCKINLKDDPPAVQQAEYVELVTVLKAQDLSELLVAKSVLEGAGIRYFAKGEGLQNLFGGGRFGLGFNSLVGPVEIQVSKEDVEAARALLAVDE
ncbi:MAG: DUF2007 domain-containing protein [Bacillota bacterium]|nr:DUF2007 domain-containing protein [Bacillota bacterium]MDW7682875.1 DUF2007 domain-containing protein [Bacillota bacterium]